MTGIYPVNPCIRTTSSPPVMEARRWLETIPRTTNCDLLNLSQAAPVAAPPRLLLQAMAEHAVNEVQAHVYGPVLGDPELRSEIAVRWSAAYSGTISDGQVAVTSGCNQAFVAVVTALARSGDSIVITAPWYFNHRMWLDMMGIEARIPANGGSLMPDPDAIAAAVSETTRAIVLITPNNPTGAEYPAGIMRAILDLARSRGIALIVDETYRDFDSRDCRPHDLFTDADWPDAFVHLYSFSKAYRLTGHRIGAIIASEWLLAEVEKFLDTVAICPNRLGQHAALTGMRCLGDWLADERTEILRRRDFMTAGFKRLGDWRLLCCGAYFAYVEHPFELASDELVLRLLADQAILALPGTMFASETGSIAAKRQMRIAYANVDIVGITELFERLQSFRI